MNKPDIAKRIARRAGVTQAEAADRLDHVVKGIVMRLKRGQEAELPGLGTLKPAAGGLVKLEPEDRSRD